MEPAILKLRGWIFTEDRYGYYKSLREKHIYHVEGGNKACVVGKVERVRSESRDVSRGQTIYCC